MEQALYDFFNTQESRQTNLNTNVKLTGNTYAYINKYGIAKQYATESDYTAMAGNSACGSSIAIPLDRNWASIGYPQGTTMKPGAPCGYENSYITTSFPASTSTDTSILSGITQLGKIGYVDVDNIFHSVDTSFSNTYAPSVSTYVQGTTMTSCLGGIIRYGDPVYIKYNQSYAITNNDTVKISSMGESIYYLQPVTGTTTGTINYGDKFLLSSTNISTTSECGTWGCFVGHVSPLSKLEMTRSTIATPFKMIPLNQNKINTPVKVNEKFCISSNDITNTINENTKIMNSTTPFISSHNNAYYLKYNNGVFAIYTTTTNAIKETIYTVVSPSSTSYILFNFGKFTFYNVANGPPVYEYPPVNTGMYPCKAILGNDGVLAIIDANNVVKWPVNKTNFDPPDNTYSSVVNNEIIFRSTPDYSFSLASILYGDGTSCSIDALKQSCNDSSNCIGFIHSAIDHKWASINQNDSVSSYQISEAPTNTYLKNISMNLTNTTNCPSTGTINKVPWNHMLLFPKGTSFPSSGATCPAIPRVNVASYDAYNNEIAKTWSTMPASDSVSLLSNTTKLNTTSTNLSSSTSSYNTAFNTVLTTYDEGPDKTIQQRITDSLVMDDQSKGLAILWGVISVSMVAILLFRPNN